MIRFKNRNLFDQLFLIFILIPVFSNIFGLFSQLTNKKFEYTSASFNKSKIIKDQIKTTELNIKRAAREESKRIKDTKLDPNVTTKLRKKGLIDNKNK